MIGASYEQYPLLSLLKKVLESNVEKVHRAIYQVRNHFLTASKILQIMDTSKLQNSDYLDMLFEGRNKNYGGYELRRNYPKRVKRSLLVLVGITLAVAAYGMANNEPLLVIPPRPVEIVCTGIEPPPMDPKKPVPPPLPAEPPPPAPPTVKFLPPVITPDNDVQELEKPPEMKDLLKATAGEETKEGDFKSLTLPGGNTTGGTGTALIEKKTPPPAEIPVYVEQMPEFNGSINKYLSDNIVYPEAPREAGIDGRVVIRFIVSEDGSVTGATVEKGVNSALDAEALRVVNGMPKWKPGKQNGRPVKVYYRVPVKFTLQ